MPCPGCGGEDRFRYDDKDGKGTFYCGGGGNPISGDGFELLHHIYGWDFRRAADEVRQVLGVEANTAQIIPLPVNKPRPSSKTSNYAHSLWKTSCNEDKKVASHPYCQRKLIEAGYGAARGIASGKLIGSQVDCVIVPQRTLSGELIGVECINSEGVKQSFGKKGFLILGNTLDKAAPIYVVEGWADGVAAWKYFGDVIVVVVFGIGRQDKVAQQLHEARPGRKIRIVRDGE
jgi:phage/plasmid primase-like uncharacterized protein